MKLGRNDLCHCGSGKKYKHCHMRIDAARSREMKSISGGAEWIQFYSTELNNAVLADAREQVALQGPSQHWPCDQEAFSDALFIQHALYDLPVGPQGALIMESSPENTTESQKNLDAFKASLSKTHISLLEVQECRRGKSIKFQDRLTGRECFVHDAKLSEALDPMEVIVGRLVEWDEQNLLLPGWEKVWFRGRKAAIRELDEAMNELDLGTDDPESRALWLRREAPRVVRRAREARPS